MARSMTARSSAGLHRTHPPERITDGGFSLIESVVAFTLFMIVTGAAIWWLVETVRLTGATRDRVRADNVAMQRLEQLRADRNAGQQLVAGTSYVHFQNGAFTVTTSLNPAGTVSCPSGQYRLVTVKVTWPAATSPVRVDSEIAC